MKGNERRRIYQLSIIIHSIIDQGTDYFVCRENYFDYGNKIRIKKAPTNLGALFNNQDYAITRGTYDFDRNKKKAEIVETLTKQEMVDLYQVKIVYHQQVF